MNTKLKTVIVDEDWNWFNQNIEYKNIIYFAINVMVHEYMEFIQINYL